MLQKQWFLVAMVLLLGLAWLAPGWGQVVNPHKWAQNGAIVVIFFLSGFCLRAEEALRGLAKWRLHAFIQIFCFVFLPCLTWVLVRLFGQDLPEGLRVGYYVLAVLPTTISSCVILTQIAGGDFAAALFNSVLANVVGIFISPLLLMALVGTGGGSLGSAHVAKIFMDLGLTVLAPLVIGQVCHQFAREASMAFRKTATMINNCCILFIVFLAFCHTFLSPLVGGADGGRLVVPLLLVVPAHWMVLGLAAIGAHLMGWSREDRVTALYCSTQKTLAMGLPFVAAVLANRPEILGLATLPLIVYHPTQLLTAAVLAQRKG